LEVSKHWSARTIPETKVNKNNFIKFINSSLIKKQSAKKRFVSLK
jgi:hypothetical protein